MDDTPHSSTMSSLPRRQIVRACKQRGWTIHPDALKGIQSVLDSDEELEDLFDALDTYVSNNKNVSAEVWREFLDAQQEDEPKRKAKVEDITIVDAFEMPKLCYEVMRKQFRIDDTRKSVFGSAQDKADMLSQRYAFIHQRLLRHDLFRPNDLGRRNTAHKITPIESLLGKSTETVLLLGILIQIEQGQYYLEDPTGQVPVSFQDLSFTGFFVTEYCIVLAEGVYVDGYFYVQRIGHPLPEPREQSITAIRQQVTHPMLSLTDTMVDQSVVVVSDLHLDQPKVLQQLEALLATYSNYSATRLPLFCFMGNFCSSSSVARGDTNSNVEELIRLIARFPTLAKHGHFCIVPGPQDQGCTTLPLPPLPRAPNSHLVAHVQYASNPCRIYWQGAEIVVFCYDLLHKFQQEQVLLAERSSEHINAPHCRLIKTILDQGHLIPVAGVPILWNYDHALRLYPMPQVLVLGGDGERAFEEVYEGCQILHPGSLLQDGSYAVYSNDIEDEEGPRVDLLKLGPDHHA